MPAALPSQHRGVVQRQAVHDVGVGVVVARQVQVAGRRHPVQRPAGGGEDQFRAAGLRSACRPSTVPPTRFQEPVVASRASVVPVSSSVPTRFTVPPVRLNVAQAGQRKQPAQVHCGVGGADRARVAPGVGRGTRLVAQIQRGARGRDRGTGGVAPGAVQRQASRPACRPSTPWLTT